MSLISLGNPDKNLIPIIIGCVFCFLNRLLNQYEGTKLFENVILTNLFIFFGGFFTIIPLIILKVRAKRVYSSTITNKIDNQTELIYTNPKYRIIIGKWKFFVLSSVISFLESILYVVTFPVKTNVWIWFIVFSSIFSIFFYKEKLYKQHFLSIIFIILIGLIIDLVLENLQNDFSNNNGWLLLMCFFRVIILSLNYVIMKYTMENKFCSIYEVNTYVCLIVFFFYGIFLLLDYYYFGLYNYEEYFNSFDWMELLVVLAVLITQLVMGLCVLNTNKYYSPCHVFIIFVFGQFANYINLSEKYSILIIICLLFMLFFSLIFNEIIEINFWGLSFNTRRKIIERAKSEIEEKYLLVKNETIEPNTEATEQIK